jgi:hypothetical protein
MSGALTRHDEHERRWLTGCTADILVREYVLFSDGQADRDVRGTGIFRRGHIMKTRMRGMIFGMVVCAVVFALSLHAVPAEENEHAHHHPHHLGLFLGNTQDGEENGFSVGLDYEYRLSDLFGVGALGEYTEGDFDHWVFGVPLLLHPYKGLVLKLVPGVEHKPKTSKSEFLVRTGIAYSFHITDRWTIAPEFNFDFADRTTKVYGAAPGYPERVCRHSPPGHRGLTTAHRPADRRASDRGVCVV